MLTKEEQRKFYNSQAWKKKRRKILKDRNYECEWCKQEGGVTTEDHATLEVDHIQDLEHHPELALDDDNLRVLCKYHHNMRHNRFEFRPQKKSKWDDERW